MKSFIAALFALVFGVVGIGGTASATPVGLTGPLQTYSSPFGGAHIATVETYLDAYLGVSDVVYLGRYIGATDTFAPEALLSGTGAFFTITGGGGPSGTWSFNHGSTTYEVVALVVSTSGNADLYAVTPPNNSGGWDTTDINGHNLSHLDFYARAVTTKAPEPASLMLVGGGLAGLRLMRKKLKRTA